MSIGLFYASDWGHTEKVAKLIEELWEQKDIKLYDLALDDIASAENHDYLIFGISTAEEHKPQLDWKRAIPKLAGLHLAGKTVALFGLGDQKEFPDHFADSLGDLYDACAKGEANIVGSYSDNEYNFKKSKAFRDGAFVGLVLDEDNQQDLTPERLDKWLGSIEQEF